MIEKIIIDIRSREEYSKDHIKGAINIALHDLEFNHDFLKNKKVFVYCNSGVRAKLAKKWLRKKNSFAKSRQFAHYHYSHYLKPS